MNLANRTRGPQQQPLSRHKVMKIHAREWDRLGDSVKSQLNAVAAQRRASREEAQRETIEADRATLALARAREIQDAEETFSMQLSSARLSEPALQGWGRILNSDVWSSEAISVERFESLVVMSPLSPEVAESMSPMAARICRARSQLRNAVLIVETEDEEQYFMIALAMLQPMALQLLPLHPIVTPPVLHQPGSRADWETMARSDFEHLWHYDHDGYVTAEVLAGVDITQVSVVPFCLHKSTCLVASMDAAVPLANWLAAQDIIPAKRTRTQDLKEASRVPSKATPQSTPSWVKHLFEQPSTSSHAISTSSSSTSAECTIGAIDENDEEPPGDAALHVAFEDAIAELQDRKAEMKECGLHQQGLFRKTLLGGNWQVQRTGRTLYGLRVDVMKGNSSMLSMCHKFKLPASASFDTMFVGNLWQLI